MGHKLEAKLNTSETVSLSICPQQLPQITYFLNGLIGVPVAIGGLCL
jgi:hypothetical protein